MGKIDETDWQAVMARALAFLCLTAADLRDKSIIEQAEVLEALGLNRADAARLLNSTERSLGEMLSRKRRAGSKSNASKKKS